MGMRPICPLAPKAYSPSENAPAASAPSSATASPAGSSPTRAASTFRIDGESGNPETICKRPAEANQSAAEDAPGLRIMRSGLGDAPGSGAAFEESKKTAPVAESAPSE